MNNTNIDLVAQSTLSTVVAEYISTVQHADSYQSEAALEQAFVDMLTTQGYEYMPITDETMMIANLRTQLQKLNNIVFTESEWTHFYNNEIASPNQSIEEKTKTIQEDHIKNLTREDGTTKNIYLLRKDNIHDNTLQVINQYATDAGARSNRYDVTVLVNGLPLVHIELKRRGVALQEAFNQISRYQRESFWAASGLFEYVQLFVISNGTQTKYYSNTTRDSHIKDGTSQTGSRTKKTSHSFEFTSWWADSNNLPITDLMDFGKTFFAKHTILNILTRYCVFTSDRLLLVMRPYQINAAEKVINTIEISTNSKTLGKLEAGGYVWHTTGSGKTLTSFKTAQLASKLPSVDKVLFVVDRKDLDYQTMMEYDKFEKNAANSSASTRELAKNLSDPTAKIIVTTIQKLDRFISKNKGHSIFDGHVVLIFDECHRSQFGDMHTAITKAFKQYNIFGFTGTPIFAKNSSASGNVNLRTTEQAFGRKLHTYTIVNAIADKNVLPFKVDYISTVKKEENIADKQVTDIDREKVLAEPKRLTNVVEYIREHFDQKTMRNSSYSIKERRVKGFNSIFAVSSIEMAKAYYNEFQKQMQDLPSDKRLKVGTIFSYGVNDEVDGSVDENSDDTSGLDGSSRDFLDKVIVDYNQMFGTNYDTSSDKFGNYYKDLSQRVKDRELDILIVVNMFLTGFDATTLNTLWIDKNLRLHGLLQAFSRTNRILNSVKRFGNIVCFRNLETATNESLAMFGDTQAGGIVLLRPYKDYYEGYTDKDGKIIRGYKELIIELQTKFPIGVPIIGEQAKKDFVILMGLILRVQNILKAFDEFAGNQILTDRNLQDYRSVYINLYSELRPGGEGEKEAINDDLIFEMELIKQIEINIDYILELIKKYHKDHIKDKEILIDINRAIDSSVDLRNKKDLINKFIEILDDNVDVETNWHEFVESKKMEELNQIILAENLNPEETIKFVKNAFRDGAIEELGTSVTKILPPIPRFGGGNKRAETKEKVLDKLKKFFARFFDISSKNFEEKLK